MVQTTWIQSGTNRNNKNRTQIKSLAIVPILIGCRGGDPDAHSLLIQGGWKYGFRSDYKAYPLVTEDATVEFVDIKWRDYKWLNHWLVLRRWRPKMAMVADYEYPEQKTVMLRQVTQIRALGIRPMVCPKFPEAAYDIPRDCIIAISVPTRYAGFLPNEDELIGRDLHLLGGHPDQFVLLIRRYWQSRINSIDCSAIFQKAQFGAFWNPEKNDWFYVEKNTMNTHDLTVLSAKNVKRYLANPPLPKNTVWNNRRAISIYQMKMMI